MSTFSPRAYLSGLLLFLLPLVPGTWVMGETGESVSIEFSCLHWDGNPEEKFYYREGDKFHLLEFRRGARSKQYSMTEMTAFELYGAVAEPKEGELPYALLAKTAIPAGVNQALFYITADKEAEEPEYKVIAMDDSLEAFPRGTFRFVNLSGQELSIEFSGQIRKIPADEMNCIPLKPGDKGGTFVPFIIRAVIQPAEQNEDDQVYDNLDQAAQEQQAEGEVKGKTLFGTRLFGQPSGRELVIIRPPSIVNSDRPRLQFYTQLLPRPLPSNG